MTFPFASSLLNSDCRPPSPSSSSFTLCLCRVLSAPRSQSVGRFEKLSEYVKSTTDKSIVEVELFRGAKDGKHNLIIQRHFDKEHESRSKFFMGDSRGMRDVTKKDVQTEMQRLNIQVNNLCVYLAQFRVGEFAELDPPGLLAETEKAANPKLYDQHMQMVDDSGSLRKRKEAESSSRRSAESLAAEVHSMEGEMRAQEERVETERKIDLLKKRIPWCRVDQARKEEERCKRIKSDACRQAHTR